MKINLAISILLFQFIFSCKNGQSKQEVITPKNESIDLYKFSGFLSDSSFSIKKYHSDINEIIENDSTIYFEKLDFDDHQFIIYNDTTIYYFFNEFPYDGFCGTQALSDFHNKNITELFEVKKEDLKRIGSDGLLQFVKNLDTRKEFSPDINSYIILGLNQEKTKNKDFQKILSFLLEKQSPFIIRPSSTRERLVSESVFENKKLKIDNLDWDSIYKVDFKNFNHSN